jgi:hypothetical protein
MRKYSPSTLAVELGMGYPEVHLQTKSVFLMIFAKVIYQTEGQTNIAKLTSPALHITCFYQKIY